MFGFLSGGCNGDYRRLYALCCQNHFVHFGRVATIFHSYESVFLATIAYDLKVIQPLATAAPKCCRLRKRKTNGEQLDIQNIPDDVGAFLASFAMLLTWIKLQDDIHDSRSWLARFAKWSLTGPIRKSFATFQSLDTNFKSSIQEILKAHATLEQRQGVSLEEFCEPTAQGFETLFRLFAQCPSMSRPCESLNSDLADLLGCIGRELGRSIISFDCAVDWQKDQRRGEFNPLQNLDEVSGALLEAKQTLSKMSWLCSKLMEAHALQTNDLPESSLAIRTIRHRFNQIASRRTYGCLESADHPTISRPRTSNRLAFRKGDCDCICPADACCSGGECCATPDCGGGGPDCDGCADGCNKCNGCGHCDPCSGCSCDPCCSHGSKKKTTKEAGKDTSAGEDSNNATDTQIQQSEIT